MDRLTPKGGKIDSQIPLQRMGDTGQSAFVAFFNVCFPNRAEVTFQRTSPTPQSSSSHQQQTGSQAQSWSSTEDNITPLKQCYRTHKVC